MKIFVLSTCTIIFFITFIIGTPYYVLSQTVTEKIISTKSVMPTLYKPIRFITVNSTNNVTNLRITNANVSSLQFTTSYNYQYLTWIEHHGRTNIIFVASSRNGGRTFDPAVNLSSTDGDASNEHFVVNLDRMYGVFVQHEPGNDDIIKFTGTNDGGTHWNTITLADTRKLVFELAIALQGDQISVAWSDVNNVNTVNHYIVNR